MQLSKSGRFVYINPPRTGTTSVWHAARDSFKDLWQPLSPSRHATVWRDEWEDFFIFTTVRHPYSRAISIWLRLVENIQLREKHLAKTLQHGKIPFADFTQNQKLVNRLSWFPCCNFLKNVPRLDHVVHLETFKKDIATVNKKIPRLRLDASCVVNPSTSRRAKKPWHEHYTEEAISTVAKVFRQDFEDYGYNTNFNEVCDGKFFVS